MRQLISFALITIFIITSFDIPKGRASEPFVSTIPLPGSMIDLSPAYVPIMIKGLRIHPENPFLFDFILDTGNSGLKVNGAEFKTESQKLIKYFLASLTIREDDLWVNLSPYEKDRIIPKELGKTELGRDMLAQDYILKQLTASLIYPEKKLGKKFWDDIYAELYRQYSPDTTAAGRDPDFQKIIANVGTINTFNKVWIVADQAKVLERNNAAFVVGSHLKVMLEEDYMALQKQKPRSQGSNHKAHTVASGVVRKVIVPAIEKEVNQGQNFAPLRQMFYSMILASWYKSALKYALLNQVYSNKKKISGVLAADPAVKQKIYEQYLKAYKKGVFNYIKDDMDTVSKQPVPRKYFSGGELIWPNGFRPNVVHNSAQVPPINLMNIGDMAMVTVKIAGKSGADAAMGHVSNMFQVLQYRDPIGIEEIDDLLILGCDNLDLFREALRFFANGKGKRIVILGGYGHGTPPLIEAVKRVGFDFSTEGMSESRIIRNVMQKMVEQEDEFIGLRQKLNPGTYDRFFLLEERSTNTPENLKNYNGLLASSGEKAHNVLFFQSPEMQLRSKATFGRVFEQEIKSGRIRDIGLTIDYDVSSKPREQVIKTAIREAWRIIIYSDYGKKDISFFETKYKTVDGIPGDFWESAKLLLMELNDDERFQFTKSLVALAMPGFSMQSVSGSFNQQMKNFVENVLTTASQANEGRVDLAMGTFPLKNVESMHEARPELAMNAKISRGADPIGGINLNAKYMSLDISKKGKGIAMRFDPAMAVQFQKSNFTGVEGIILRIVPIQSPLPLLGL